MIETPSYDLRLRLVRNVPSSGSYPQLSRAPELPPEAR